MSRGKRNRAATGLALGDGFPTFRRVLTSETLPPLDDIFAVWREVCASRLEEFVFVAFTNQPDGITNMPAYAAWHLFNGLRMHAESQGEEDRRSGMWVLQNGINLIQSNTGIFRTENNWLRVRDEFAKFAALAVEELNKRIAIATQLQGEIAATPKPVKRDAKVEARDKWIYEQCCKKIEYDTISRQLSKRPNWISCRKSWEYVAATRPISAFVRPRRWSPKWERN